VICQVELTLWISRDDPVTRGDADRLAATVCAYLDRAAGIPALHAWTDENVLCLTASVTAPEEDGWFADRDASEKYVRESLEEVLRQAGFCEDWIDDR
jgi:hypothetical protein